MARKSAEDFLQMHARQRLGEDGRPAMREDLVTHFDAQLHQREDQAPAITLDEALARLIAEKPLYAWPVVLCELPRLDERTAAPLLDKDHSRVNRNKREGLAKLAQWTGLDVEEIRERLRGASPLL